MHLDGPTQARLDDAMAGMHSPKLLRVADLRPGDIGVLTVRVLDLDHRGFRRKDGSDGRLCRVRLTDGSAEVALVLWDGDAERAWAPGTWLRIAGATVKDGYRGGMELARGAGLIEEIESPADAASTGERRLQGTLQDLVPRAGGVDCCIDGTWIRLPEVPGEIGDVVDVGPVTDHPLLDDWYQPT